MPEGRRIPQHLIALGTERTFEQDPALALRILVDIAVKALSPATNDPTTAVQVLDRIEDLLMLLAQRDLTSTQLRDRAGRPRVVVRSPSWQEFLLLGVTEIRQYGAASIQVVRRLRSLLGDLADAVPDEFRASVDQELAKLDLTVARNFVDEADLTLAATGLSSHWTGKVVATNEPGRSRPTTDAT
jgi:uncharacterized membrane protein